MRVVLDRAIGDCGCWWCIADGRGRVDVVVEKTGACETWVLVNFGGWKLDLNSGLAEDETSSVDERALAAGRTAFTAGGRCLGTAGRLEDGVIFVSAVDGCLKGVLVGVLAAGRFRLCFCTL